MNVNVTLTLCNHNILVQISIAFTVVVSHILAPGPPSLSEVLHCMAFLALGLQDLTILSRSSCSCKTVLGTSASQLECPAKLESRCRGKKYPHFLLRVKDETLAASRPLWNTPPPAYLQGQATLSHRPPQAGREYQVTKFTQKSFSVANFMYIQTLIYKYVELYMATLGSFKCLPGGVGFKFLKTNFTTSFFMVSRSWWAKKPI